MCVSEEGGGSIANILPKLNVSKATLTYIMCTYRACANDIHYGTHRACAKRYRTYQYTYTYILCESLLANS